MEVRPETPTDFEAVDDLLTAAFDTDDEARLVAALRETTSFDGELALVGIEDGEVVGYVLFTRLTIPGTSHPENHLVLAPVAIHPDRHGEGLGTALVQAGLDRAEARGYGSVLLHGSPQFYGRFGFTVAGAYGLQNPFDLPDEDFQALELADDALRRAAGPVRYPAPFEDL